ncbi:hypothetical protein BJV74DRAFT_877832 [Russula compacta]|nr:hypothetical protein BJV74DRAFT_877832 [Russula compacta]
MSLVTRDNRVSVKQFASIPALIGLPAIMRSAPSVSVDLNEGCMVTKLVKYTHQLAHFVNAVRTGDSGDIEKIIEELAIIPFEDFTLDSPCNLAFLESYIHTSMDLYAFIAIVPSSSTLDELIQMVKSDNDVRQRAIDRQGLMVYRSLNFTAPCFVNPQYELLALHPEHFLPNGSPLTVYDHATGEYKNYVAARDQCLRETVDPRSRRLPPFHHDAETREDFLHLNVYLVALNAEIKFRRYLEMVRARPPPTPLPDHVLSLMHRTIELVSLLYWRPTPTKGSKGERILAEKLASSRKNPGRASRPDPAKTMERRSSEEWGMEEEEDLQIPSNISAPSRRRQKFHWPEDMDLEARMAYGRALMSGHDGDYDPALYEDAFAIGDAIDTWQQSVSPEN